ncbi:hypothetical protein A6A08_01325 [Nocardiopsis sp. TSRI0078]|uniref:hypothetical protein n=1 Tax=unclassified Nocardiopsis TaxID=2649073 RepID=UPI0009632E72|nr:hypothetical protein [Nocardiopsis sp. TSRI0078]OKI23461.1 hypothetical protein A6A08_01325 [Nocardiopsis sp. TSRI0078]
MSAGRRGQGGAFTVVLVLLAALVVYMGASNIDRSLRAARAEGEPGTFTASRLDCVQHPGHESCTCYGSYAPDAGGAERADVYLYGRDRETCPIGEPTEAIDIGAASRVYGPEGSNEWVMTAGVVLVGLAIGGWALRPWWPRRRRETD